MLPGFFLQIQSWKGPDGLNNPAANSQARDYNVAGPAPNLLWDWLADRGDLPLLVAFLWPPYQALGRSVACGLGLGS